MIDKVPVQLVQSLAQDPGVQILRKAGLRPFGIAFNFVTRTSPGRTRFGRPSILRCRSRRSPNGCSSDFAKAPDSPLAFDTVGHKTVGKATFDQAKAQGASRRGRLSAGRTAALLDALSSRRAFPGRHCRRRDRRASLKQVGVEVTSRRSSAARISTCSGRTVRRRHGTLPCFGFNPSNAAGLYHMESLFKSNTDDAARPDVWNMGRYRNPKVDAALKRGEHQSR